VDTGFPSENATTRAEVEHFPIPFNREVLEQHPPSLARGARRACRCLWSIPYTWAKDCLLSSGLSFRQPWEVAMILVELMFALMLAAVALLVVPILLLMAGVAGIVLLWALAPTAVVIALIMWLAFPHATGLAVLVFLAVVGVLLLERRSRQIAVRHWY
jgi:hypothetical protein